MNVSLTNDAVSTIYQSGNIVGHNIPWGDNTITCHQYYWDWWYPNNHYSYPVYIENKNKCEQAFKIVQKLIDKKLVKISKVKDFVDLVNEITAIL